MDLNLVSKFTLKPFKAVKVKTSSREKSRRCLARIVKDNGIFKAEVSLLNKEVNSDLIIIPLTKESFDLKGKLYVFTKYPDKHGKPALIIRDPYKANTNLGLDSQYCTVKENIIVSGHVVTENGRRYFNYENLVSFIPNGTMINPVKVDTSRPLFET